MVEECGREEILLADIGNTHFHIYDGEQVQHLSYAEAMEGFAGRRLFYISVKASLGEEIEKIAQWQDISDWVHIEGEYEGMGVDRKALCLSRADGIFVDAGSAITVDVVSGGRYQGGYILPGIRAMLESYAGISEVLDVELNENISLDQVPRTTKDGISYGIIGSIKALIEKHKETKDIYVTGGDGKLLCGFLENGILNNMLVFDGMQKVIKESKIC